MTLPLRLLEIFELRPLITNLNCKLSTVSEYDAHKQLLCLVSEENDIVLRYTSESGQEVLKLISWFRRTNRVIHDVCFDPTGTWLLVLCFDNTLHIVPALAVVDRTYMAEHQAHLQHQQQPSQQQRADQKYAQQPPYSTTQVTSYIIPFVGPHECPNSKGCPNHTTHAACKSQPKAAATIATHNDQQQQDQQQKQLEQVTENLEQLQLASNEIQENVAVAATSAPDTDKSTVTVTVTTTKPPSADDVLATVPEECEDPEMQPPTMEKFSHDVPADMLAPPSTVGLDKAGNSQVMSSSFMASNTCPYPLSVVWWRTIDGVNRAVIGYSDGSICFVGLSPNCPFVASTAITNGSVVKLWLCRDNTFESVMLLITSSLKQQYKLLLEQKAIKYTYPGDISPSSAQPRDSDWQIVLPLKPQTANNSNSSDPASDNSQPEDDVFAKQDEPSNGTTATIAAPNMSTTMPANRLKSASNAQLPPPPPYSVAVNRHHSVSADSTTATTTMAPSSATCVAPTATTGVRFQQQPLDDYYANGGAGSAAAGSGGVGVGAGGILPAARARLASLRSLGTKKLNAIKMRLSDNRQKMEEYMPENTLCPSFVIMDSPSLTPEVLGVSSHGSFYTIQNLRNTYLLSALHSQSNSLSVHNIDNNLKPLFLYKIPENCFDILISSNLLYSIQYVDFKEEEQEQQATVSKPVSNATELTTEKENRDTMLEKQEKAVELNAVAIDLSGAAGEHDDCDSDKILLSAPSSSLGANDAYVSTANTSATTSGASTDSCMTPSNMVNAVGVISSAMASLRTGDEDKFNVSAQLGLFRFQNETVLNLYQMATYRTANETTQPISKDEKSKAFAYQAIHSPMDYVQFYKNASNEQEEYSLRQMKIMQNEFPNITYDPCYVVTNKNVYYLQLKKEHFTIFLDAALAGEWAQCREFCTTFDLLYEACIEFAGDYLLRHKKVTQALLTYNAARIKPIRTALKLAMFGQTNALMHLCAMALKSTYVLKSKYFAHPILKTILDDVTYRHSEDVRIILPPTPSTYASSNKVINEGASCSDYMYGVDESLSNLQMSPSSQFHLANLLLITLAEKAVNDKNYIPLWNFLCVNNKYHTNMTSIVLCQSGLFSAALLLAKMRGVCIDTFLALTSVVGQEFGWYTELNVCLYNLSERMFTETITYLPHVAVDYFNFVQDKLERVRMCVLQRLEQQLNPFSAMLRPIVSHTSSGRLEHNLNDNNSHLFEFCRNLIETYLAVLIHMDSQRTKHEHITNALSTFRITYEDNQFAIETSRFKPISAGCLHCACVVDGIAYFWGSNGVPCNYSINKSSDPPEPSHAVKSLELISQLNLEVHAVKCGRQHTLVLTNNGLYTLGSNNLCQLGIGKDMQMSLQPMLVEAFDGKNITTLEAGQYHNAVVADGLLYTWGWGVYGQLGHGDTENVAVPRVVTFFENKKVIQVSLGHAHSLVLCQVGAKHEQSNNTTNATTELYVFGSNHFGQLGLGAASLVVDEWSCGAQVKSLVPLKLDVCTAGIRLIHTKFFTNLAVDDNERMYTWGSSPQALRLANQIRRRANAKQKFEEHQRRELKRWEATLVTNMAPEPSVSGNQESAEQTTETVAESSTAETVSETIAVAAVNAEITDETQEPSNVEMNVPLSLVATVEQHVTAARHADAALSGAADVDLVITNETVNSNSVTITDEVISSSSVQVIDDVVEELVPEVKPLKAQPVKTELPTSEHVLDSQKIDFSQPKQPIAEVDPCEHMSPQLVDTSEVAGHILQISSGLFHFALISSSCTLYTWGKNLEHQLGTEDKERRAVHKPSPIDSIERPMYVDCGADFTLVMTTDYVVKAFGGNSNGQCGRDLGPSIDKVKQRVVCLPSTKRLMRFESQCVEAPVEINLPRPRIRLDSEPVRYLKSIPRYQTHFMQEANIKFDDETDAFEQPSPSQQYKSSAQGEDSSADNAVTGQDSEDLISSLENLSNNEENSSLNVSLNAPLALEVHEVQLLPTETVKVEEESDKSVGTTVDPTALRSAMAMEECGSLSTSKSVTAVGDIEVQLDRSEQDAVELQQLRHYIHYCLYVFHGLYNPDKVREYAPEPRLEYRIRTLMLNFKFVDAYTLCLQACDNAQKALRMFEYFSKDATGCVPMRRQDLKYLIYYLLLHFLSHKFDVLEAERYFLADLDYYLLELAYVMYFNNNNTVLEHDLNQKFKSLIGQEDSAQLAAGVSGSGNYNVSCADVPNQSAAQPQAQQQCSVHKLDDTDVIFDSLSVKFKTIVCQRLLKHCSN